MSAFVDDSVGRPGTGLQSDKEENHADNAITITRKNNNNKNIIPVSPRPVSAEVTAAEEARTATTGP
jgi:hypothetical protein